MTIAAAAAAPKQQPLPSGRMKLSNLIVGRQEKPQRILLYGLEGVGKSTFGADAPEPVFLGAEDGTSHLDVKRLPKPESWLDVLDGIRELEQAEHGFRTLVVDTLDWVEPLLWAHICARDEQASIEAYGYGKGYQAALDEWRIFLAALERLRSRRAMHVVLLAHSWIKPFKNPEGDDFDRYELKLNNKAGGLLKEWCDHVLFATFLTYAHKKDPKSKIERAKGVSSGARVIFTLRTAAYDAKHRGSMRECLPLSWSDFAAALKAGGPIDPATLATEIERKAKLITDEKAKAGALEALTRAGADQQKLEQLNNWVNAKLAELGVQP